MKTKSCALLLTGGGARAAYQVGVLKAIAELYPRNHHSPFNILCGTSAGGINIAALACYASCFRLGVKKLDFMWRNFRTNQVYQTDMLQLSGKILRNFCASFQADYAYKPGFSLLDNTPLRELLNRYMEFERIDRNILAGAINAAAITASDYTTGDSISFFQSNGNHQPWQRAKRKGVNAILNAEHLLATSAIPLLFPPCQIGQDYYGDGSVHQLSPLSPAIHLGAEKILVISLEQPRIKPNAPRHVPNISEISGHLLDTIFTDTLNSDLERLNRVNSTLALLEQTQQHPMQLKTIESFVIKPSQGFNHIADKHYDALPLSVKLLLRSLGIKKGSQSTLTSYLMFEQNYTRELIQLGYQDCHNQMEALQAFLFD
ncbi:patatin-like phospholipase family protein [Motilimonas cestriensis]|uniref:Patatin-like phospholipase family protein n=1 Tax=Motilimonas cestriensis TaxID=2742685 RepID=A0ABS8W7Q3_9GAMM|nr:patatin-like phospholipase family protein [Motilimonas cestriensis]MCE2594583.1 patatin-like phospholipase family protein [Motilimonas cestriensis]